MSETNTNQQTTQQTDPAASGTQEKTFTQDQVSSIAAKEAGIAERKILQSLGLKSKEEIAALNEKLKAADNNTISALSSERDDWKGKFQTAHSELELLENNTILSSFDVPADDMDYYAYKINKLVSQEKDFKTAATEYFKEHPLKKARVSTAAEFVSGGQQQTENVNDAANDFIRRRTRNGRND